MVAEHRRWVELRVHGVSGTPPGSMLDRPHVEQVGGDDESRFFRSVDAAGKELPGKEGQVLEAYHWGRLTSGSRVNALWLILLPFGMVNAAHYMLPAPARNPWRLGLHATCDALMRLIGLLVTSMYAFAAGLILIDLIGWRWAARSDLLTMLDARWVLLPAVLLSAGVVVLLAYLGRGYGRTRVARWRADEEEGESARQRAAQGPADVGVSTPLANDEFYSGDSRTPELKDLHIAAGLLVIAAMAVWVVEPDAWTAAGTDASAATWLDGPNTLVAAVIGWGVVALVVLLFGDPEGGTRTWSSAGQTWIGRSWSGATRLVAPLLLVVSSAILALAAVAVLRATGISRAGQERPTSFDLVANYLLLIGVAALVALLVANLLLVIPGGFARRPRSEPERYFAPYAGGLAAATVTLMGTFIGVAFAAALTTGVSSLLQLAEPAADAAATGGGEVTVGTTPMLDRVAYAWGLNAVVLVALVVGVWAWRLRRNGPMKRRVAAVYGDTLSPRWLKKVHRAVRLAHMKNAIGFFFVTFAVVGLLFSFVVAWELSGCLNDSAEPCLQAPGPLDWLSEPKYVLGDDGTAQKNVVGLVGAWLILAAAGVLLLQGRKAVRAEDKRRTLNVIWDVLAFWPHAVHPFSPRPYSKRCVQDLCDRISWHLRDDAAPRPGRDLVLCGHSQGSLISFAALLRLEPEKRDRVALMTFGSQLRVIFPRAFPAYVNFAAIRHLYEDLGGAWVNLYRLTDPLAGPVLSWGHRDGSSYHFPGPADEVDRLHGHHTLRCGADWQLADPVPADPQLQEGAVAEILGHSWFARSPAWCEGLEAVRSVPPSGVRGG
ncbi:hypothetical protein [Nocardioides antri]|uniref:Lipase family protein n=1 Tax=Nocardioides antri TaxID=2607659 RepID=A0A5B1M6P8_9ACTN|nr:hypothetical protein [Nocardioides antri]KAA1427507.1 hypothetical protein F0U47_08560 [Nocardioides antri]